MMICKPQPTIATGLSHSLHRCHLYHVTAVKAYFDWDREGPLLNGDTTCPERWQTHPFLFSGVPPGLFSENILLTPMLVLCLMYFGFSILIDL